MGFVSLLLGNTAVQGAVAVLLVALIVHFSKKYKWTKTVALVASDAYQYAEEKGILQGLKGYEKFDPFMDKLIELVRKEFGRDPTPEEKGMAVKVMEELVLSEHQGK